MRRALPSQTRVSRRRQSSSEQRGGTMPAFGWHVCCGGPPRSTLDIRVGWVNVVNLGLENLGDIRIWIERLQGIPRVPLPLSSFDTPPCSTHPGFPSHVFFCRKVFGGGYKTVLSVPRMSAWSLPAPQVKRPPAAALRRTHFCAFFVHAARRVLLWRRRTELCVLRQVPRRMHVYSLAIDTHCSWLVTTVVGAFLVSAASIGTLRTPYSPLILTLLFSLTYKDIAKRPLCPRGGAISCNAIPADAMWPCVALCGPMWPCVALCGPVWPCVAQHGPVWPCVALCGPVWPCVALCGSV